jgi:iron(III) transport system ATP-binding protein
VAETKGASLALEGLVRRFGARPVVDGVSFDAPRGRVTVLVGPSGCGKTTLLRLIAGIERPDAGRILVDGEEVVGDRTFVPPERRRVGLMFQDYALFPHLTLRDNVLFGLGGLPRSVRGRIADEALERVGLARFADRRPGALSGGEQQRLALARALAPSPRILLMDEPFSNLDRGLREEVRAGTLSLLREAGVTTLLVTHDPEEALAIGDHLVLLGEGGVMQAGPAAELYASPASVAAARALSDVNLVPGEVRDGMLRTPLGPVPAAAGGEGETGFAAFRPEQLAPVQAGEGVKGRIEARSFRGASTLLTVRVEGVPEPLRMIVPTDRVPHGPEIAVAALGAGIALPGA